MMLKRAMLVLVALLMAKNSCAELLVLEKEVEELVANDQSREQVEAFALQKAKRLAVEEAGTYISSLTVVSNAMLHRDEITALASGVVQAKIIGLPNVRLEKGVVHVNVKARIQVDTAVLDKQIAELLKEKGAIKKLEAEQKKVLELEAKLSNLKSTELKRLEELNLQAITLEQERERRRLVNAELALKAQGELKKAEIERLQQERELQERTARMLSEQEQQRKNEAEILAQEHDRIRRAQLENEQRWNDLSRKAQLAQQLWVAIDDTLSLKQALEESDAIKNEIATIRRRSEFQHDESVRTLKAAYEQQIAVTTPKLPPAITGKDPFESTGEYKARLAVYEKQVNLAKEESSQKVKNLKTEETLKVLEAELDYLKQQVKVLEPFVRRLQTLQEQRYVLPGEAVQVELGLPDADRQCFPVTISNKDKSWKVEWEYTDRNLARDLYNTRTFLRAEALVQLDNDAPTRYILSAARLNHPGTERQRTFYLAEPDTFTEIQAFKSAKHDLADSERKLKAVREKKHQEEAAIRRQKRQDEMKKGAKNGLFFEGSVVTEIESNLMWTRDANIAQKKMSWNEATQWVKTLRVGGYDDWRLATKDELKGMLRRGGGNPPVNLSNMGFANVKEGYYCSATEKKDSGKDVVWIVDMEYEFRGDLHSLAGRDKGFWLGDYVWPVRDAQ